MKRGGDSLHKKFMRIAIHEAKKGKRNTGLNPLVGCVIVKDKKIIAKSFHKRFGGPHAEIIALKKARGYAKGARLYVNLEPCSSFGKTPPCSKAIIESGIKEVIVAMPDPNPIHNGKGIRQLRKCGIKVISGIMRKEARRLNKDFVERIGKKRPFITIKIAQSLDGKIATRTGDSKWISSQNSRALVHRLRSSHDAVMVGVNTILKDNPLLTNRLSVRAYQPKKIVIDSRLSTPMSAAIFSKESPAKVIIGATYKAPIKKEVLLQMQGAEVIRVKSDYSGKVDLKTLMQILKNKGINSILAEGGGELTGSLFKEALADRLFLFIAPIIIGGKDSISSVGGDGIEKIKEAYRLTDIKARKIGPDFLVEGNIKSQRFIGDRYV